MLTRSRIYLLIAACWISLLNHAQEAPFTIDECFADELVAGCIDPISGAFLNQAVDLSIPHSGGLEVVRNHNSKRQLPITHNLFHFSPRWPSNALNMFENWCWNHGTASYYRGGKYHAINQAGQAIVYEMESLKNLGIVKHKFSAHKQNFKGWTNCRNGLITARIDLHNGKVERSCRKAPWEIVEPSGIRHIYAGPKYSKEGRRHDFEELQTESERIFPSGLRYLYTHTGVLNLTGISCINRSGATLASLKPVDLHHLPSRLFEIHASSGDWVRYTLEREWKGFFPTRVESSQQPTIEYTYARFNLGNLESLCPVSKISKPDGRYRRIEYIDLGKRFMDSYPEYNRKNYTKVKAYYGPGSDGREVALYTLEYADNSTSAQDALGQKRVYSFDPDYRLQSIDLYEASGTLHSSRYMRWSKEPVEGRLERCWVQDAAGSSPAMKQCEYDEHGNVTKEITWTRLKAASKNPCLDKEGLLQNAKDTDSYEMRYRYSDDDLHLLTERVCPGGRKDQFIYEPNSDRKIAHLVWWNDQLCERHLWSYDAFAEVDGEIHDDGNSEDLKSLSGVHQRTIKKICRHEEGPLIGLVAYESHSYLDLTTSQEIELYRIDFDYTPRRLVRYKKITDCVSGQIARSSYEYDDKGNCIAEVLPNGARLTKSYDANNNLLWQSGPVPGIQAHFIYDKNDRLKEKKTAYPDGTWLESYSYDEMGQLLSKTDPYGIREEYSYDAAGHVIEKRTYGTLGLDFKPTSTPLIERFRYDALGNLIEKVDARGFIYSYLYNGLGQLLLEKKPDGQSLSYLYNSAQQLIAKIYNDLWSESLVYDKQGRIVEVYRLEGSNRTLIQQNSYQGSLLSSQMDALGHEDRYGYDGAGRKIWHERQDADSGKLSREEWSYSGLGEILCHRKWQNETDYIEEVSAYDALGLLVEQFHRNQLGEVQGHKQYVRNEAGLLIETRYLDGEKTSYEYFVRDAHGYVIEHTDQLSHKTRYNRHYLNPGIGGAIGTLIEEIRPSGDRSLTWEDSFGRAVEIKIFDAEEKLCDHKYLSYDAAHHLVFRLQECLAGGVSTGKPVATRLLYGPDDLILERWDAQGTDLERHRQWIYDSYGRCIEKKDPQICHFYTYDAQGRVLRSWSDDGTIDYLYSYDLLSRPVCVQSLLSAHQTLRSYDAWDRVIEETLENGLCYQRAFDALGQVTSELYPDDLELSRHYVGGRLRLVERKGSLNYEHAISDYDSQGRPLKEKMPLNQGAITRTYDLLGRVTSLNRPGYRAHQIRYDQRGRLTQRTVSDHRSAHQENYSYDALDQLTKEKGAIDHTYLHDSRYRRLSKDDTLTAVDSLDQIESVISPDEASSNFVYDPDGRLLSFTQGEVSWQLTYDAWSRLTLIKNNELEVSYSYDAYDRCMNCTKKKKEQISEKSYGYIDRRLVTILGEHERQHRLFVRGDSSEQGDTLSWEVDGRVYLPVLDLCGSTVGWLDEKGSTLAAWFYDAFGVLHGERLGPWGYCSKLEDSDTGFVYFSKRYYLPQWGRWLTKDPRGEIDGSNLYAYVGNNPLTRVDSWGLMVDIDRGSYNDRPINFEDPDYHTQGYMSEEAYAGWLGYLGDRAIFDKSPDYAQLSPNLYFVKCPDNLRKTYSNRATGLVNGSCNTREDALKNAHILACVLGTDVYLGYIQTEGPIDLPKALLERNNSRPIPKAHAEVVLELCKEATQNGTRPMDLFLHSRGFHAAKEANSLYGELHSDIFDQVSIWGVEGSGTIRGDIYYKSMENTVCSSDFVILLFDNGAIEQQRACGMLNEVKPYDGCDKGPRTFLEHNFDCPTSRSTIERYAKKIAEVAQ